MAATSGDRTPASGRLSRTAWLWPALLTLAITGVQITRAPLWRDELATWSAASRSTVDLLRMVHHVDAVNGPFYLLTHFWIRIFGDSVFALRLPAMLAMTGAAALATRLGQRLFDTRAGVVAGLLFAVVPSTSRYGQEARAYALVTLFAVLSTLLLVRAVERPGRLLWVNYSAAVTGLGLAHIFAVVLLAAHAVPVLIRAGRLRGWLVALVLPVLILLPLALVGRGQQHRQLGWVPTPGITSLADLPGGVLQGATVGGLLVGLAAVGMSCRGRWGLFLGLCVLLPTTALFVGGLVSPLWVPRYLVFVVPFLCLLAAATLTPLRLPAVVAVLALVCLLGLPDQRGLRRTHEWPRSGPVDYPAAVRIIADHQHPGDAIVYSPRDRGYLDVAVAYYLRGSRPRDVLLAGSAVQRADLFATECDQPARCLAGADRVWLLVKPGSSAASRVRAATDPLAALPSAKAVPLRGEFRIDQVWNVPGLAVALLVRR